MTTQSQAQRFRCPDCGNTYRSFRTQQEWFTSHKTDVCSAKAEAAPSVGLLDNLWTVLGLAIASVGLLAVALSTYGMMSDGGNASGGIKQMLQVPLTVAVVGPCLYGIYRMVQCAIEAWHPRPA